MNKIPFPKSRIRQAAEAFSLLLNPSFFLRFSVPDYLASQGRPRGWWVWFPRLHFCLFNAPARGLPSVLNHQVDRLDPARKTVLFVSHEASRSGAPILLLNLMNEFRKEYNVALICMEGGGILRKFHDMASWFIPPRSGVFNVPAMFKREIGRLLERTDIAFAIVNTLDASEALRHLCKRGIPSIHLVHEFPIHPGGRWGLKVSSLYADATVYSSRLLQRDAASKYPPAGTSKSRVLPQGIFHPSCEAPAEDGGTSGKDLRAVLRKGLPDDALLVIGGGTVDYRKGVDLFLSCARKTMDRLPGHPVRFAWIGWGFHGQAAKPYPSFVKDQVEKHGLGEHFLALDEVPDFRRACEAADVFLLPSRLDPLPVVAQTAMDCGLPLLCFREATGVTEFLETDSEASFGACPYMDVQAMTDKLTELLSDEVLRKKVGDACERVAKSQFSASDYVSRLRELALEVQKSKKEEKEDAQIIASSGRFDASFSFAAKRRPYIDPVTHYLRSWRTGIKLRKPAPGIHPGIYEERTGGGGGRDPFANFLREGSPEGPWCLPVIVPSGKKKRLRPSRADVALHLHLYYHANARELFRRINRSATKPDLFISVPSDEAAHDVSAILGAFDFNHVVRSVPNRGRDIGPLLTEFSKDLQRYEFIGHVHSKETHHVAQRWFVEQWVEFLFENVLGGRYPMIDVILGEMMAGKKLGLVFPDDPHVIGWTANLPFAESLAAPLRLPLPLPEHITFPAGTMFWARSKALKPLFDLNLGWNDYPEEPVPIDGSMLHAIERMLPLVTESSGYECMVTNIPGITR